MKIHNIALLVFLLAGCVMIGPRVVFAQNIAIDSDISSEDFILEDDNYEPIEKSDPFQRYNRWMFNVNDTIYRRFFTPVSRGYDKIIPKPIQKGLHNFSQFIRSPIRIVNNLFQLKLKNTCTEVGRFVVNGTVGIVGLFDPAKTQLGWEQKSEDFAQTLGHYGVGSGPYVVLPLFGPSDPRDFVGMLVDMATQPMTWVAQDDTTTEKVYIAYQLLNNINNYSYNVRDTYQRIIDGAIDEYIAVQEIYYQNTEKNIDR